MPSVPSADELLGPYNVEKFNSIIETLNLSPISSRNMRSLDYRIKKSVEITKAVRHDILGMDAMDVDKVEAFEEIINQLKEKFNSPGIDRNDQLKILSVLPKSWSINKIVEEFEAPIYMVRQVKQLVNKQGMYHKGSKWAWN